MDELVVGMLSRKKDLLDVFTWDIPNYKQLVSKGTNSKILKSETYVMRHATWGLGIGHLPSYNMRKDVYVYIYRYDSEKRRHFISYQIILEENKTQLCKIDKTSVFRTGMVLGVRSAVATEDKLFKNMSNGTLSVICIVHPEMLEQPKPAKCSLLPDKGIDILSSNMKDLFLKRENCDFVVKVMDTDFHVHKAVLSARSPVLSAMLQHDMKEKKSNMIHIIDSFPDVFEHFLLYLYSGEVEKLSWENVTQLYTLGDKYDLEHLRIECVHFMEGSMCISGFCDALELAVKHKLVSLIQCAEHFFMENAKLILLTTQWMMLMGRNPGVCNDVFLKHVSYLSDKEDGNLPHCMAKSAKRFKFA